MRTPHLRSLAIFVWAVIWFGAFSVSRSLADPAESGKKDEQPAAPAADAPVHEAGAVDRPIIDKWALVIGISKFKNPAINLKYAAKDAKDFADFLIKEEHFAPDHVKVLTDEHATRANILSLLGDRWLPRVANPDDLVLIFVSSHGSPSAIDVGGVNYLLAHDSDPENLFASGIPMQDLARVIKGRVHSDRVVVVLDACHSGATSPDGKGLIRYGNVDAEDIAQGTGQLIISSSKPDQRSWEATDGANGVFTKYLLSALKVNGEGTRLGEAFEFLRNKVQEQVLRDRGVLQTPVMKSKWEGRDLVLAVPPASPRPGLDVTLPDNPSAAPQAGQASQRAPSPAAPEPKDQKDQPEEVPKVWHSLEKNPWGTLLGTWVYHADRKEFEASYNTGATAKIALEEFGPERVRLSGRFAPSLTAPKGQEFSFTGTRAGKKVYGNVIYRHLGLRVKGRWEAWWE